MNLKSIKIKNYRGIKELALGLDPGTTVLIGENNSGKTSVLLAIDACDVPAALVERREILDRMQLCSGSLRLGRYAKSFLCSDCAGLAKPFCSTKWKK